MSPIHWFVAHVSLIFIITSPVTSYADQIWSIHKHKSSAGFSLDVPLIMLVASILKLLYWLGARYETSLLIQAGIMVVIHVVLLHVALSNRPSQSALPQPFGGARGLQPQTMSGGKRPWNFWQWRSTRPYWQFLMYYTLGLFVLQALFGPQAWFVTLQGYIALSIEAILPLPQILANQRNRSCKGFRFSVLANWLVGDAFKMFYFFYISPGSIPWAFKLCALFQAACDVYLGVQYQMFGNGPVDEFPMIPIGEKAERVS